MTRTDLEVAIPTADRPACLAATLTSLAGQRVRPARVVVSDQGESPAAAEPAVVAALRLLEHLGVAVDLHRHLPRRGLAEQRQHLVEATSRRELLLLDDDVLLAPAALGLMRQALVELGCGFVGMPVVGLSYRDDVRPEELADFEPWEDRVRPERVRRSTPAWQRWRLHNAANPLHLAQRLALSPDGADGYVAYRVAWVGGCVLYDRQALLEAGAFGFWPQLPPVHCGEDVVAQLAVMEQRGGAGILPSLAFHQEAPTTVRDRRAEAYDVLGLDALAEVGDLYGSPEVADALAR
ncbi:MAG: glycosyltransferase [Actinomycetales bacterium]